MLKNPLIKEPKITDPTCLDNCRQKDEQHLLLTLAD